MAKKNPFNNDTTLLEKPKTEIQEGWRRFQENKTKIKEFQGHSR